ncbi:transglutaminase-like putative cysteine protease [Cupriavidus gilardii J11]|uniref:Transglutaminase-like putative cysteine protease n=1 Tax=Cupriavidus gilardii J11 TaxID=936133 RepID=A0A562BSW1_9BURK|nr:transglutaminase family protein [Cupriavidus gilardii]TWG88358.1 transglutaminase-like putative cysteine protease [Cupriavidus gilardii J11]
MTYRIHHRTVYRYAEPVVRSVHELRLAPRSGPLQEVRGWQLSVPGNLSEAVDGFGNIVHHFTLARPADTITIVASGEVEPRPLPASEPLFGDAPPEGEARVSPLYFRSSTPLTAAPEALVSFAAPYLAAGHGTAALLALAQAIGERVRYQPNTTDVGTSAAEAFGLGAGVCQDQAQVMVAACRAFGIPARYVSGYFHDPAATYLASHAWADVCVDTDRELWCSIDVTHGCFTDARHVRLAVGRDYRSAAPIRGVREGGGTETMSVEIVIEVIS